MNWIQESLWWCWESVTYGRPSIAHLSLSSKSAILLSLETLNIWEQQTSVSQNKVVKIRMYSHPCIACLIFSRILLLYSGPSRALLVPSLFLRINFHPLLVCKFKSSIIGQLPAYRWVDEMSWLLFLLTAAAFMHIKPYSNLLHIYLLLLTSRYSCAVFHIMLLSWYGFNSFT